MALLQDLIQQIDDSALRDRILQETNKLLKQKKFGLVFEDHLPECTPLYDVPIRVGSKVALKTGYVSDIYTVINIDGDDVQCDRRETHEQKTFKLDELVTVAEFGEAIYPTLKQIDTVENAPDSDLWHTLIEADNYHALQLLEYLYAERVDCIYIDPPYNTGAKDWKYNNDYVDDKDAYRHSKWLSFMEKRLRLAKKLLNPNTGVLIATIDEHEVHHLRCLLEDIFQDYYIQMVTYVSNPTGATQGRFSRIEEYAIYCFAKDAYVASFDDPMIGENNESKEVRWKSLLRSGTDARREDRKNMFYPIYVDIKKGVVVDAGEALSFEEEPDSSPVNGYEVAWPIRTDGTYGRWSVGAETFRELIAKGYVQLGRYDRKRKTYGITYISSETQKMISDGTVIISGKDESTGVVKIEYANSHTQAVRTVWYRTRHNAGVYGTNLLSSILCETGSFTFPKSLYSTKDAIATIVKDNPRALIIDFFAGSGTTLHAINLLNAQDGGSRRCVLVTNNEVSDKESKSLKKQGYKPGDNKWEDLGIARHITWRRTVCSIKGHDVKGNALQGNYLECETPLADGFKANAAFFKLNFLDKTSVALGKQFRELLPVLWMKGGAIGRCPDLENNNLPNMLILLQNKMAVLVDEIYYSEFDVELSKHPEIQTVFIVTDSETAYRSMICTYDGKDCYQLYRDYLDNFRINTGR